MLIDGHGRTVDYLRVSVTERCNFRCQYCMPEKPFSWVPKENLLSFEELFLFMKVAIDEGVNKIRITGGEPLLREGLDTFIKMIHDYKPDIDLALTTNAYLLPQTAQKLKDAGLKRLNISLDSLKPEVAHQIAQKDVLDQVLKGIDKALEVGLGVKINMVPMKGINDDEILDIIEYCKERNIKVRFIEYMENAHANQAIEGMHGREILNKVKEYFFSKPMRIKSFGVLTMFFGAGIGLYTGVLLSSLGARPLWSSSILWMLFLISGLSGAAAFVHVIAKNVYERELLAKADNAFLIIELFIIALFIIGLKTATEVQASAADLLLTGSFASAFWVFVIGLGIVVPLIIQMRAVNHKIKHTPIAPLMVILGGLILRFVIVEAGQFSHWFTTY